MIVLTGGELQDRRDVLIFQEGILGQYLFPTRAPSKQLEHILHTDTKTAHAGTATTHVWQVLTRAPDVLPPLLAPLERIEKDVVRPWRAANSATAPDQPGARTALGHNSLLGRSELA
jgi:hypothetical protein